MNLVNKISCLMVIGSLLWSFCQYRCGLVVNGYKHLEQKTIKIKWELMAVLIIMLAGFFRLYMLGAVPEAVNQDSAMSAIDAKSLMTLGTDHWGIKWPVHMKGWGYGHQSPLLTYLLIPFFRLIGISDFALHLPMVLVSMAGMLFFYLTVRDLWGKKLAIISLVIVSFNPWHFAQSRWALDANLFPHVFMAGFYFLQKGLTKSRYLYLSMILFALSHYSYGISIYTVPFFLLLVLIWLLRSGQINKHTESQRDGLEWSHVIWSMIIYVGISLPFFITMLLNAFHLPTISTPLFTMPYFAESVRSGDILFFSEHPWEQLLINGKAVFRLLVLQKLNILWDGVPEYGTVYLAMIPLFFVGIYALLNMVRKETVKSQKNGYVMLSIWVIIALLSGFITKEVNINRINWFHYAQIILISLGIKWIARYSRQACVVIMSLLVLLSVVYVREYFTDYAASFDSWDTFSYNFTKALRDTAQRECEVFYITPSSQHPTAKDVSEIDTVYVHDLDIAYFMGKTNRSNGKDLNPYQKQYQYIKASELEIDANLDAVYLINEEDRNLFSEEQFVIKQYKQFCVVIPRQYE